MAGIAATIIGTLAKPVTDLISEFIEDPDKANEFKHKFDMAVQQNAHTIEAKAADIIIAEAKGESWLQRNWRPLTMVFFLFIVFWNAVIVPVAWAAGYPLPVLEAMTAVPDQVWNIIMIGLGGYIAGRSGEKMMKTWKGNG